MKNERETYDPDVLNDLECVFGVESKYTVKELMIHELRASIIFFEDVNNLEEKLLLTRSLDINKMITRRLINYASSSSVKEPIKVIAPLD